METVKEIVDGLRCYFDKALSAMLLYKEERQQYKEVIAEDALPSDVYGAEHLLRLFGMLKSMYLNNIIKALQYYFLDILI